MVFMAPKDEDELRHMLFTAISHNGPIAVRYPRGTAVGVNINSKLNKLDIGKGEVLQQGKDMALIAIGSGVQEALNASSILRDKGIEATVVNSRFVKPLDVELIAGLANNFKHIITVEENVRQGGFGSAVLECLNEEGLSGVNLRRIGIADTFVEHGPQRVLRSKYGVDATAIVTAAEQMLG
jgi:1-deoxy-D-xylulose-5-phosphate synthase